MLWQEAHPEIESFEGFDAFKADLFSWIDVNFRLFLRRGVKHEIRLEEIVWGGVLKDGIPALNDPKHLSSAAATYITDDELVFGVEINSDVRAYPLRMLDWHEMFNDVIGGVPVALAYCTLCGSDILFETLVEGRPERFVFGSSGFLFRSNKLMYDQETNSLWNQFTGRPVVGPLTGSGIELAVRPVAITTWKRWAGTTSRHQGAVPRYGIRSRLHAGASLRKLLLEPRSDVSGACRGHAAKAEGLRLRVAQRRAREGVAVVGIRGWPSHQRPNRHARCRAHRRCGLANGFAPTTPAAVTSRLRRAVPTPSNREGQSWTIAEESLISEDGQTLPRLPGHIAY